MDTTITGLTGAMTSGGPTDTTDSGLMDITALDLEAITAMEIITIVMGMAAAADTAAEVMVVGMAVAVIVRANRESGSG
ncbi:MAG: hypothetical protein AB2L11_11555 [Syntrophobacteraceae bacterium]